MRTLFLLFFSFIASARAELINGIYAVVNDTVITYQEVENAVAPLDQAILSQHRYQAEIAAQKRQQVRTEKVEELIRRHLILHEFKTGPYQLPESIIDDQIRERIRARFGDRVTLTKTLQAEGMTFEGYRKQVREDFIESALTHSKISSEKIVVSPYKIEKYYGKHQDEFKVADQVKLRMIVLNKSASNPEAARKLADEILAKLKEGASFTDMATIYSDSQKDKGGERGWVERSYLKKELSDVAFSLQAGQFSNVIELPGEGEQAGACYLLLVEEMKTAHIKPLADVHASIEKTLNQQEQNRLRDQWIERLKAKSFVRYF